MIDLHLPYSTRGRIAAGLAALLVAAGLVVGGLFASGALSSTPGQIIYHPPTPVPFSASSFCKQLESARSVLVAFPTIPATASDQELTDLINRAGQLHARLTNTSNYAKISPVKQTFFEMAPNVFWLRFHLMAYKKAHDPAELAKAQHYAGLYNSQLAALSSSSLSTGKLHCPASGS